MHSTEVENQLAIYVQPEVVVSGEFKDDVMAPGVQTIGCLCEACFQLHPEEVIDTVSSCIPHTLFIIADQVKVFSLAGIGIRKFMCQHIRLIGDDVAIFIICVSFIRGNVIVRHELAMFPGSFMLSITCDRAELVIYRKGAVRVQMRKVLRTVILKVPAFVVDVLKEQMIGIHLLSTVEQLRQRVRITVHDWITCDRIQTGRKQPCTSVRSPHNLGLYHITITCRIFLYIVIKINHLHGDAVSLAVDRFNGRHILRMLLFFHDGKVKIFCL